MRLRDLERYEPLRVLPKQIPARCWNRARIVLIRKGAPLRVELEGLRALVYELDEESWVLWPPPHAGEVPLMAWTAFVRPEAALHRPIHCELRLYHLHAGLLMSRALEALEGALARTIQAP